MSNFIKELFPVAHNMYLVKRKGKVIKGESRKIRNAAKRSRRELRSA